MSTFRHSGKLGDIIYSLPAVKALGGGTFYVDHRTRYPGKAPLGRQTALMMVDLLKTQDYIAQACLYEGASIQYDLDKFRDKTFHIHIFNLINRQADDIAGSLFGGLAKELRRLIIPPIEVDLRRLTGKAPVCRARSI